jgi:predicted Zn-dependent peptidase
LAEALFPDHALGREVLGTRASLEAMGRDEIRAFHSRWYRPANLVVSAAGALGHDEVVDGVERRFAGVAGGEVPARVAPQAPSAPSIVERRSVEQAHLAVGFRALARGDHDRFALAVANQILGGGMSSRLFQRIREERGLAYNVLSYPVAYVDTGALVIYAGTAPVRLEEVRGLVDVELDRFLADGPTDVELRVAKGYLAGSTVLGLEDSGGCMSRIGKAVLNFGAVYDVEELLARYRAVTLADVRRVTERVLGGERSVAVLGPKRVVGRQVATS